MEEGLGDKSRGIISYRQEMVRICGALTLWSGDVFSDYALQARLVRLRRGFLG